MTSARGARPMRAPRPARGAERPSFAKLRAAPAALVTAGVAAVHLAPAVLAVAGFAAARATPAMLSAAGLAAARATPAVLSAAGLAAARIAPAVLTAAGLTLSGPGCKSERAATTAAPPSVAIDPTPVNALVPAELKGRLVFERRELATLRAAHQATYALAAPSGWAQTSKHFAHLRPAGATAAVPRFEIGTNCDGTCTAKPWDAIADRVHFAPLARGKIVQDERGPGRRTMIADIERAGEPVTEVVVAWWTDGEPRYHVCTAVLDPALKPAAPAFARACQAVAITGDD